MNPFLQKLGFGPQDRVAIVHADDIGAYQASIPAIDDLLHAGLVSSCAAMVPCPWFPEAAAWARRNPSADVGVHATLTAEYGAYRWGPISTCDPASGMLDGDGYLHGTTAAAMGAAPDAVAAEHMAQVERALAAGIDVTHVDSHMGASFSPAFLPGYIAAAARAGVPAMVPRMSIEAVMARGTSREWSERLVAFQREVDEAGLPMLDHIAFMPLDRHQDRVSEAKAVFDSLPVGLSYLLLHPAIDTPELRALTPVDWPARAADHAAFCSRELRDYVAGSGVHVIGWRAIRDAMRA
jgi:chitin disaccharide deacetylase